MSCVARMKVHTIIETKEPGFTKARIVSVDPNILIDDYDPRVLWYCENCGIGNPVTAQFKSQSGQFITLCAMCLQHALNGIALSRANPVSFDAE